MRQASFVMLTLVMLVSLFGTSNLLAYADESQESSERKFLPHEIYNSFEVSEPYVNFGENKHITIDTESMEIDGISDLDIEIMTKWATYTNILVKAMISNNQTDVNMILNDSKTGQFSLLTNPVNVDDSDAYVGGSHAILRTYGGACGVSYANPYTWQGRAVTSYPYHDETSEFVLKLKIINDGYKKSPVTTNEDYDFQKINKVGMGGCTGGEFRDQRVMHQGNPEDSDIRLQNGWFARQHTNEPNPDVLSYWWPVVWWPAYVAAWHVIN